MDEAIIEIVGLVAAVIAGFLITPALGFAGISAGCLWVSWNRARVKRRKAEADIARRARIQ